MIVVSAGTQPKKDTLLWVTKAAFAVFDFVPDILEEDLEILDPETSLKSISKFSPCFYSSHQSSMVIKPSTEVSADEVHYSK